LSSNIMKLLSRGFVFAALAMISTLAQSSNPIVATPLWPALAEAPMKSARLAVNGNLAVVADAVYGFRLIDVSTPASAHTVGGVRAQWTPAAVASAGTVAAVLDASAGRVTLINIANSAQPAVVGKYETTGLLNDVAIQGNTLLIADSAGALILVNIANPAAPVLFSKFNTVGPATRVVSSGTTAFVSCGSAGVDAINIATPAQPVHIVTYAGSAAAGELAISGNFLFLNFYSPLAGWGNSTINIVRVNVADPAHPVFSGSFSVTELTEISRLSASGVQVFAAGVSGDFRTPYGRVVDFTLSSSPQITGNYNTGGALSGSTIFAATDNRFHAAQKTAPPLFTDVGVINSAVATRLSVAGTVGSAVVNSNELRVLNFANPQNIQTLGKLAMDPAPVEVTGAPGVVYVINAFSDVKIVDVSAPASPQSHDTSMTGAQKLVVNGTRLHLLSLNSIVQTFDITNPLQPTPFRDLGLQAPATDMAVSGNFAYVAEGAAGVEILDVHEASLPAGVAVFPTVNATAILVEGARAYVSDGSAGLKIINITDPHNPALLGMAPVTGAISNIVKLGNIVFAQQNAAIVAFDVSDSTQPTLIALNTTISAAAFASSAGSAWLVSVGGEIGALSLSPFFSPASVVNGQARMAWHSSVAGHLETRAPNGTTWTTVANSAGTNQITFAQDLPARWFRVSIP
jgi:hypothetical protein